MIQIQNIPLPPGEGIDQLRRKAAELLGLSEAALPELMLSRQSIDARKKQNVHYVCTVELTLPDEAAIVARAQSPAVKLVERVAYRFPDVAVKPTDRPVVVGMGPAGLFAALFLARAGIPSLILERGRPVERRAADVARFWQTGTLDPSSNVQFGEGGAGTFSDGKLTTGIHDPRVSAVLQTLVGAGAPTDILYLQKPHIGTDLLRIAVRNIRAELLSLGCEIRFEHTLCGLRTRDGQITELEIDGPQGRYTHPCRTLILAPGHSARDTFEMLFDAGLPMQPKPFALGLRIEHLQTDISQAQLGPDYQSFPAADYKLACHLPSGRSAFTFCVCPGGQVVAAASEAGGVVTNGMSLRARDGQNCNGGLLVGVSPADFGSAHPLSGIAFQRRWEQAAFALAGGGHLAPIQTVGDFLGGRTGTKPDKILPTYAPGVTPADLTECLPPYVAETLREALPLLGRKLSGFSNPQAVLTGVETRSSSPVRLLRGENLQSAIGGLYPCGEGAGYAGGITSAAVDGIRVAEQVALFSATL